MKKDHKLADIGKAEKLKATIGGSGKRGRSRSTARPRTTNTDGKFDKKLFFCVERRR